jgi:hypothetical protein
VPTNCEAFRLEVFCGDSIEMTPRTVHASNTVALTIRQHADLVIMVERQAQAPRTWDQARQDVKGKERPPYPSKVDV